VQTGSIDFNYNWTSLNLLNLKLDNLLNKYEVVKNIAKDLPYTKSTRMNNMKQPTNLKSLTRTHKNTQYNPRFGNHHKRCPTPRWGTQKGRVFSNPNPPQADHKGQGNLFPNQLKERVIQTSWGRPQIWRLPSNL
jgi:hypothetical protein